IRWMLLPKPSPILPFFGGQALGKLWIKKYPVLFTKKCRLKILEAQNKPISPTALFFDFVVLP
ncbi:TPA: hypothetical protein ACKNX4_002216, partial [Neisseria gonorrhoeae]